MRLPFAHVPHDRLHCEGEGIIPRVPVSPLIPSDELMSRIQAELEDMPHIMYVGQLLDCCPLIKLGMQALNGILGLILMKPFLQCKPVMCLHQAATEANKHIFWKPRKASS